MADSVKIKRGVRSNLPKSLPLGELAFCTDTRELYVGAGEGLPLKKVIDPDVIKGQQKLNEQLNTIANMGTTLEVLEKAMEKEIQKQIEEGNMTHMTIAEVSVNHRKIASGAIHPEKTSFIDFVNDNALKNVQFTVGKAVDYGNGTLFSSNAYMVTDFIQVNPGDKYRSNNSYHIAFYNQHKEYVCGYAGGMYDRNNIIIPNDVYYMRKNFDNNNAVPSLIKITDKIIGDQYALKLSDAKVMDLVRRTINTEGMVCDIPSNRKIALKDIEGFQNKNTNLVSYSQLIKGGYYDKGVWITNGGYNSTPYIPTNEGITYYCNEKNIVCFYDKNLLPIKQLWGSSEWGGNTFTTPKGTAYITVNFNHSTKKPKLFIGDKDLGEDNIVADETLKSVITNVVSDYNKDCGIRKTGDIKLTESTNLINPETFIPHMCILSDGVVYDFTNKPESEYYGYGVTDYIEINSNLAYSVGERAVGHIMEYDKSMKLIKFNMGNTIKFPHVFSKNTKYIRINILITHLNKVIFGQSDQFPIPTYSKYKAPRITLDSIEGFNYKKNSNLYQPWTDEAENTAISTSGNVFEIQGYQASGYIAVEPNQYFCISQTNNMAMYGKDKTFVRGYGGATWEKKLLIPEDVYYIRVTWSLSQQYVRQINKGEILLPYENPTNINIEFEDDKQGQAFAKALVPYLNIGGTKLQGLKWNVLGDSITSTDYSRPNWWEIIKDKYDMTVNNYGISGTTLAHTHDRHLWDYQFTKLDASKIGYVQNDPSTWATGNCFVERFARMSNDADIITVMGSTNDGSVKMGEWNSTDTTTLCGALNVLIMGLIKKYPSKVIMFCTPIQSANCYKTNVANPSAELDKKSSEHTLSIQLRAELIKRKCGQYGIPCLDLFNSSGISGVPGRKEVMYRQGDTLHPSKEGNVLMARRIENFLLQLL